MRCRLNRVEERWTSPRSSAASTGLSALDVPLPRIVLGTLYLIFGVVIQFL
ncbi:hypothetical protein [Microbacterium sp.]|uniref:hypothetical protein n=1 Tax=Microbacterium sp. TaxID=51671 RepID=UPI003F9D1E19